MSKAGKRMIVNTPAVTIGIDIGKYTHVAVAVMPDGRFTKTFSLHNTREGYEALLERIRLWKEESRTGDVIIGMESTGHYWEVPARWLAGKGLRVVLVNAVHTKRAKEIEDNSPGKTDAKDARIIAQLVRYGKYLSCVLPEGAMAELRELTRIRQHIITELTQKRNYLRRLLDSVFPEIFTVFRKSWGKTFLHLVRLYPLPEDLIDEGLPVVAGRLRQECRNLMVKKIERLHSLAVDTVGVPVARRAYASGIRNTAGRILTLQEEKVRVEKQMEDLLAGVPEARFLQSLRGVGVVSAAIILGETGGLSRYSSSREILKLAGLNLFEVSSGMHRGKVRISKRGRPLLRHILFILATVQAKEGMPLHGEYRNLIGKRMAPVKALIALSRKLVRLLFALVRDERCYTEKMSAVMTKAA